MAFILMKCGWEMVLYRKIWAIHMPEILPWFWWHYGWDMTQSLLELLITAKNKKIINEFICQDFVAFFLKNSLHKGWLMISYNIFRKHFKYLKKWNGLDFNKMWVRYWCFIGKFCLYYGSNIFQLDIIHVLFWFRGEIILPCSA